MTQQRGCSARWTFGPTSVAVLVFSKQKMEAFPNKKQAWHEVCEDWNKGPWRLCQSP